MGRRGERSGVGRRGVRKETEEKRGERGEKQRKNRREERGEKIPSRARRRTMGLPSEW